MPKVADFIENNRERLIERFTQEAGRLESASGLGSHELIDTVPEYLAALATVSRQGCQGDAAETKKRLQETHIGMRLRHGYTQEEVTSEYVLIGRLVSSQWEDLPTREQPAFEDTELFFAALQEAMEQVVATFSGYTLADRQAEKRTLRRLTALAPESLTRDSLPTTGPSRLAPLLQIIQDALQADGAELLLVDATGTHLEFAAATGCYPTAPAGAVASLRAASFVAQVATSEEPVLLSDARTTPLELRDEVRRSGLRSLLASRLWPYGKLLGVLTLGVKETRAFEPQVKHRFETLVEYLSGILERALLVGELRHSEVRFRRLVEAGIIGILEWDASGRITDANDALLHMLGYTREDLKAGRLGSRAHHTPPEHQEPTRRAVQAVKETGILQAFEKQYLHRDGHRVDVLMSGASLDEERGIAIVLDISERKRAEARLELLSRTSALGASLDYQRTLAQVAQFVVPELADWCFVDLIDEDGKSQRVEVAFRDPAKAALAEQARRFPPGNNPQQPSHQGLRAGKPLLIPDYTEELLRQHVRDQEHLELFLRIGVRSLIAVPLEVHGRRLAVMSFATTDESGRRYGPEDLVLVEEVARRAAQAVENARLHRSLQQNEALLKTVIETLPVGVWVTDARGTLTLSNAAARRIWEGAPHVGLEGYSTFQAWRMDTGQRIAPEEWAMARALRTGKPILDEVLRIRTFAGTERLILNSAVPLRDAEGRITGGISVNEDITEQMQAQEEVRRRAEFEQQLIGIVSHDLRNPLGAITLGARALLQRDDLNERQTKNVVRIQSSAERAIRLIRDLLDFTQARLGGGIPVNRKPMDVHGLTRQVVDEVQLVHPERRIDVRAEGDGRGEWDPDRLAQVLSNLLSNALSYSPPDTPVTVSTRAEEGAVVLEVHNEGTPIPPEQLPRLFEPMERGAPQKDRVGRSIGLGLFIVKSIVEAHGGTTTVRSGAEGTAFTVRLPRQGAGSTS
jgi:PAS domain S-box-containing protein